MSTSEKDTFALLRYYSLKHKTPTIEFDPFVTFVEKYITRYRQERPSLEELAVDTPAAVVRQLEILSENHLCSLEYENDRLKKITFPQFYMDLVHEAYKVLEVKPEKPFPTRDSLAKPLPDEVVQTVDIQTDFIRTIEQPAEFRSRVLRLVFPDQIREMVVTVDLIRKPLIEYCIAKIRLYLNTQRNADYVRHKLLVVFQQRDLILKETLDGVISRTAEAAASFLDPSEFSFSFWAHLTNFIIQEYRQKETKLTDEHAFCQAAWILTSYNTFFKGKMQKEREEDNALRLLLTGLKQPPYVFSMADLFGMKDKNGLRIAKRTSAERVHTFINSRMIPEKDRSIPEVIRLKTDNGQYFIHRDNIFTYILSEITRVSADLRDAYGMEWTENFRRYQYTEAMTSDLAFAQDMERRVRAGFPHLSALLEYDLLSVARREVQAPADVMVYINGLFSESRTDVKPLQDILGLRRKELFDMARLRLSFWELLPNIKQLMSFFSRLFQPRRKNAGSRESAPRRETVPGRAGGTGSPSAAAYAQQTTKKAVRTGDSPEEERSSARSVREQSEAYLAAVLKLKEQLVGKNTSIEKRLEELEAKWNPLYDETAKRNLVQDTDAMIRDYFRSLKRGFRIKPPDAERLQRLAETLAENKAFDRIRRKEYFLEYIRIYLLKLLGEK